MKEIFIFFIKTYKYILSPLFPQSCRFVPTCSEYSIDAIEKYGVIKGGSLLLRRMLKCHPFGSDGYDPVK